MREKYIDITRTRMVFAKYWLEQKKVLLLLFAAIAAFLTIWLSLYYSFNAPNLFRPHFQVGYYFVGLSISGLLSASFLFSDLRSKPRAISYLMTPASQLEKVLCTMIFGVLIFWIGYSVVFSCVNWIFVNLSNNRSRTNSEVINILTIHRYQNPFLDSSSSTLYYIYFSVHAIFALGSLYFTRYAFFKTLIICLLLWAVLFFTPTFILGFLPPGAWLFSLATYEVFDYRENFIINLPGWFSISVYFFFGFAVSIILWIATYFRLTERQIS